MPNTNPNLFEPPDRKTYFVQLILPVPIAKFFTYRVPFELNNLVAIGQRVVVPFGQRNILTGIIKAIDETPPQNYEAKLLLDILEEVPAFNSYMLQFTDWIGAYYMANPGDVLNIALPAGLKVSSESIVQLNPSFEPPQNLALEEAYIISYLQANEKIDYQEIPNLVGKKNISPLIKSLIKREAIILYDKVKERYTPKFVKYIRINPALISKEGELQAVFEKLESKPKQQNILITYLKLIPVLEQPDLNKKGIKKKILIDNGCSTSSLKTLEKAKIIESFEVLAPRFDQQIETAPSHPLSNEQADAYKNILKSFEKNNIAYLHGVTGSGKTEIYIELIKEVLNNGEQVLFLVPEIALTTQLVTRLQKVLGSDVGVYHSRFSDNERVEVWQGVQSHRYNFVIGVRSSLFLPFDNLGLIIIDEEHEPSYKQANPSPRYHARDAALILAHIHHAKVVMGSGTPSVESYYQAVQGKYSLITLNKRFGGSVLPNITLADISREKKKKTMKGHISLQLFKAIETTFAQRKQVIIFQNRRGYAPYLNCTVCGWTPQCNRCDVSLTYHMYKNELKCHYCGNAEAVPATCEECGSTEVKTNNYGTEQLEESLQLLFPEQKVARMDQDTTRGKHSFDKLITGFATGDIDMLVGTQMVAKGLDFENVQLVGIFDIDRMIHFPDFRSAERTFNLATQVAGRAGRRKTQGEVIIQSYNPKQNLIDYITNHDYLAFYTNEIEERELFAYPPFIRLINITIRHTDVKKAEGSAYRLVDQLNANLPNTLKVYGPIQPVITKIRNKYLYEILIKIPRETKNLNALKTIIWKSGQQVLVNQDFKGVQVLFNVDPM